MPPSCAFYSGPALLLVEELIKKGSCVKAGNRKREKMGGKKTIIMYLAM